MADPTIRPASRDSVAVVTGASSGIGLAFSQRLARLGFRVIAVSRDGADAAIVLGTLDGVGHEHIAADLSTAAGTDRVVSLLATVQAPEVLVNAAGRGVPAPFASGELRDELSMLDLNVRAPLVLTHAALRAMRAAGRGTVITVASTAGLWSGGTYSASKSWIVAFSRGVSTSLAGSGVQLTCVAPGFTSTPFFEHAQVPLRGRKAGWLWLSPGLVVDECLKGAARGRALVIPTRRYRLLVWLALAIPSGARARLVAAVSRSAGIG